MEKNKCRDDFLRLEAAKVGPIAAEALVGQLTANMSLEARACYMPKKKEGPLTCEVVRVCWIVQGGLSWPSDAIPVKNDETRQLKEPKIVPRSDLIDKPPTRCL
ncbi:hypothetical protein CRG98_012456 [Punica granatum]|uniref:Uncharacterized protein n=1 Tax=Punica granatum TaxID=22663 RepID=A0A2I0KF55_PUNGR|nr:hypothetical protein CRG98_012456 [Punica granatum]